LLKRSIFQVARGLLKIAPNASRNSFGVLFASLIGYLANVSSLANEPIGSVELGLSDCATVVFGLAQS
jgi:hypothetical protein